MTTAQAHRHHIWNMDINEDLVVQANQGINQKPRTVHYLRTKWLKNKHGGLDHLSALDAIQKYAEDNTEVY